MIERMVHVDSDRAGLEPVVEQVVPPAGLCTVVQHQHQYEPRVSVEIEHNSRGTRWNVQVAANSEVTVRDLADHITDWLTERFGA